MVGHAGDNLQFSYVLSDSWYGNSKNMQFVHQKNQKRKKSLCIKIIFANCSHEENENRITQVINTQSQESGLILRNISY